MRRNLKVVLDTNIFLYSLSDNYESSCVKITNLIDTRKLDVLFAQDTFGELIYMVKHWSRKNLNNKTDRLNLLHSFVDLFYNSLSLNTSTISCPKIVDPSDEMFIKIALKGKVDYLISDDEESKMHINNEIKKLGIKVVKADEFIKIYNQLEKVS